MHIARLHLPLPDGPPAELLAFLDEALEVVRADVAAHKPGSAEVAVSEVVSGICTASDAAVQVQVRRHNECGCLLL